MIFRLCGLKMVLVQFSLTLRGKLWEELESLVEHQGLYFKEIDWSDQFFSPAYPHKKIKQKSRPTE